MPNPRIALDQRNQVAIAKASPLYDRINSVWEKAEDFFRSQGILAPVSYCYTGDHNSEQYLGLQKMSGKWRLCHGYFNNSDPDGTEWKLITDEPIERRVSLLKYIAELYEKLVESNEAVIPKLENAAEEAEKTLLSLGLK